KIEESLNVTFDETPPPSKTSPLVDDDLDEEEAIKVTEKKNLENDIVDETLEIDEIINIKVSRNHPLENVIGILNQRTLRNMTVIGTKWLFRNKLDENGIVSQNKARLVSQGYNQQEGINYDETYAPVARLESIRILLAYACALDFKLFQMDVKSVFLNGFINEEVYVAQPPGFIDFEKPDHVYKLMKALYGLNNHLKLGPISCLVSAFMPASKRLPKPLTLKRLNVSSDTLKSEKLERIVVREEVVTPLSPPLSINHLHLNDDDDDDGNDEGTSRLVSDQDTRSFHYPVDRILALLLCKYAVLSTSYCLEERIRFLDCRIQYVVLGRRFDMSYPTSGYDVSGVVRFGKRGKLNPRYVGPFKVLEEIRKVAYKLELPNELSRVHNTFHVSNLKKCHADEPLAVPLDGLHFDDKLHFVEEPVEIIDHEVKRLKQSQIPLVKVRWNSKRGPEFTWEREDQFRKKYPRLFAKAASSSSFTS
nr:putative reverse transcriptase domain-containing protein [Tanacetum cinerariifolium]